MSILQRPEGIWGAILLPVKNDKIDWVAFEEQVNILCDSSVTLESHKIFTCSSNATQSILSFLTGNKIAPQIPSGLFKLLIILVFV